MSQTVKLRRIKTKIGTTNVSMVVMNQEDINVKVREELGHFLLIDGNDCYEMFLLASLFHHAMKTHDVIFLERSDDLHCDLFIFNGAITPLTRKDLRKIKSTIRCVKSETYSIQLLDSHDESVWDSWEHWRYDEQLRVKADMNLAVINSTQLGFELLVQSCGYLATSFSGHSHFDWDSTQKSIELIIRNMERNK